MRLHPRTAAVVLALLAASAAGAAPDDAVTMKPVKYDELVRTVHGLQGKVVVVDFWAHY